MKKRIVLSKKPRTLFTIPVDQLKLVVGGTGVIVQGDEPWVNGVGTSPSDSTEVGK